MFFLLALSSIPTGWHAYSQILLSFEPKFACADAQNVFNFTYNFTEYRDLTVPGPVLILSSLFYKIIEIFIFIMKIALFYFDVKIRLKDYRKFNMTEGKAKCHTFDFGSDPIDSDISAQEIISTKDPIYCDSEEWIFDTSEFSKTATSEWGNVCSKKQLSTMGKY